MINNIVGLTKLFIVIAVCTIAVFVTMMTSAKADELKFSWSEYTGQADGIRLYQDSSDNNIQEIAIDINTATIQAPTDGDCHNYWIRAYRGDMESGNSDIATYCPDDTDPPIVTRPVSIGGFTITTIVTPITSD